MKFNIKEIMNLLPHAYPFLLVDRVIECVPAKSIFSIKNVSINEPFFIGHFPDNPVMPGVLILESMAQTCAICILSFLKEKGENGKKPSNVYLTSVENAKFRHIVTPGDVLKIRSEVMKSKQKFYKFSCSCYVEDNLVSECQISAKGE